MAFALNAANETTVVLNSAEWDGDSICMSMTSLIGGLTMLIGRHNVSARFHGFVLSSELNKSISYNFLIISKSLCYL